MLLLLLMMMMLLLHGRQAELADVDYIAILALNSGHLGIARELVLAQIGRWQLFSFVFALENLLLQGAPSSGGLIWRLDVRQRAYLVIQLDRAHFYFEISERTLVIDFGQEWALIALLSCVATVIAEALLR